MREQLLGIIQCPACGNCEKEKFGLFKEEVDSLEIKKGRLVCNICREAYEIKDGILDLLHKPDRQVLEEIEGNVKAAEEGASRYSDKMLLSLPEAAESENPLDPSYRYSTNFYMMLKNLQVEGDELVLDLGSGTTWSANKIARMGCRCVALDISRPKFKGLESADTYFRHYGVYYERVISDMKRLPFADNSFDIVMSNSSIHHASGLKPVLKEIHRVLKERGRLALINEAVCGVFSVVRNNRRKHIPGFVKRFHWTENTYSIIQYLEYIKSEGFDNTGIFFPPSIDNKLSVLRKAKVDFRNKMVKHRLAYLVSFFWFDYVFYKKILKKLVFWPAMIIFGMPLLLIAEKAGNGNLTGRK